MKFELNDKQLALLTKWQAGLKKQKKNKGIHLYYTYMFHPTGIGDIVTVKCEQTGDELDLSMVEHW